MLWPPWLSRSWTSPGSQPLAKVQSHILLQHLLGVTPSAQGFGGDMDELDVGLALMGFSVEEPVDSDRTGSRENQHF